MQSVPITSFVVTLPIILVVEVEQSVRCYVSLSVCLSLCVSLCPAISPSDVACRRAYVFLPMLLTFIFFLVVPLEINYLRTYWTDLYQIFRKSTLARSIRSSFRDRSRDRFLARIGENWRTVPPLFSAQAVHNSTKDGSIATRMRALTPPTTLLRPIKIW